MEYFLVLLLLSTNTDGTIERYYKFFSLKTVTLGAALSYHPDHSKLGKFELLKHFATDHLAAGADSKIRGLIDNFQKLYAPLHDSLWQQG